MMHMAEANQEDRVRAMDRLPRYSATGHPSIEQLMA